MKIFPAIDIINGECVRLTKGLAENKTIYDKSPVEMAKIYQDKGFETIHVVDLDATLGKGNNDKTLDLIRKNININIEVAGGIRDKIAIQNKINQGFDIIVIGTFAIKGIDEVSKFEKKNLIIPHMGWNSLKVKKDDKILTTTFNEKDFYFVHSYIYEKVKASDVLATTKYGKNFPSVVNKGNIYGVQFHPEKSHKNGLKLIKNFILNS